MSSDIGRAVALLLAIVLAVVAPLTIRAEARNTTVNSLAQAAVDELTAKVRTEGAVTLAAYEELLRQLSEIGLVCETSLQVGRHELKYSLTDSSGMALCGSLSFAGNSIPAAVPCSAHVHTAACYMGHNHAALGCTYHEHSSSCYCSGTMTRCYWTESAFSPCSTCGGTGAVGTTKVCSACNGAGTYTVKWTCNNCTKGTMLKNEVCPKCNGSGVNSKGKTCSHCSGYGMKGVKYPCDQCGAVGYTWGTVKCQTCKGSGSESATKPCSSCSGSGGSYYSLNHYECNVCGGGSTTSYGGSCGLRACGYNYTGYSCGIASNDTNPICNRIIVDASYESEQSLTVNDSAASLNTDVTVRYLNGETETVKAGVDGERVFTETGEATVNMSLTGYYKTASGYGTKQLPVHVIVVERGIICDECGRKYYPDLNGNDNGCPYCYHGVIGIRVDCKKTEYMPGDEFEADVYAVRDDGSESRVPADEVWNTFDPKRSGEMTVFVGYQQYFQEVDVRVIGGETDIPTPVPPESGYTGTGDDEDENKKNTVQETENRETGTQTEESWETGNTQGNTDDIFNALAQEDVIYTAYEEVLGTDEIVDLLVNGGRIDLNSGDVFSVRIIVKNAKRYAGWLSGRDKTYTSGVIID